MCNYTGEWEVYMNVSSSNFNDTGNFSKDSTYLNSTSSCLNESITNSSLQETKEGKALYVIYAVHDVRSHISGAFL